MATQVPLVLLVNFHEESEFIARVIRGCMPAGAPVPKVVVENRVFGPGATIEEGVREVVEAGVFDAVVINNYYGSGSKFAEAIPEKFRARTIFAWRNTVTAESASYAALGYSHFTTSIELGSFMKNFLNAACCAA